MRAVEAARLQPSQSVTRCLSYITYLVEHSVIDRPHIGTSMPEASFACCEAGYTKDCAPGSTIAYAEWRDNVLSSFCQVHCDTYRCNPPLYLGSPHEQANTGGQRCDHCVTIDGLLIGHCDLHDSQSQPYGLSSRAECLQWQYERADWLSPRTRHNSRPAHGNHQLKPIAACGHADLCAGRSYWRVRVWICATLQWFERAISAALAQR
jgi:hypothetical protein